MTYTIEQIRQLNLHGPQTVMELCDEIERLQKRLESATDTKNGLGFQLYCLECKQRAEDCQCTAKTERHQMTIPEYDADACKHMMFEYDKDAPEKKIECRLCGTLTKMTGTELCDVCWQLETRITQRPAIARRILESMNPKCGKCNGTGECSYCNGTGLI